jgi:hypothetical protein
MILRVKFKIRLDWIGNSSDQDATAWLHRKMQLPLADNLLINMKILHATQTLPESTLLTILREDLLPKSGDNNAEFCEICELFKSWNITLFVCLFDWVLRIGHMATFQLYWWRKTSGALPCINSGTNGHMSRTTDVP